MRALALAVLLLAPITTHAASPEDAYLAARDRDIAAVKALQTSKDTTTGDTLGEKDLKDLEQMLKAVVGPVAVAGFPTEGNINLGSLSSYDEGFGTLDGLVFGEGDKSVIVTTDGLFNAWLLGHSHWDKDNNLPSSANVAVTTERFYTQAVSTDAAVVNLADIPVVTPPGATFTHAILSARTQDTIPNAPEEIFVALEHGGRVFVVNEKLMTPIRPIAACDALMAAYSKKAEAADAKAGAAIVRKKRALMAQADKLRADGDTAFRACFKEKVNATPAFKAAMDQVTAVVAVFAR